MCFDVTNQCQILGNLKICLLRVSELYIKLSKQYIWISTSFWIWVGESQFRYQAVLWCNSLRFLHSSVATFKMYWYLYVIWLRLLHQKSLNFMAVLWHRYFLIKYFIQHTQEFSIFVAVTNSSKAQNCFHKNVCFITCCGAELSKKDMYLKVW